MKLKNNFSVVIVVSLLLILVGCTYNGSEGKNKAKVLDNSDKKDFVEPYIDNNPIKLSLYLNDNGTRNKITSYNSSLIQYKDIVSLEVYYTSDDTIGASNQKEMWNRYYDTYQEINEYKIGYHIKFKTNDGEVDTNILSPNDVFSFFDYIQVYLYDDINQESSFYSHLENDDVTEKTLFTSIKLTASTKIAEVVSPIVISAFTYLNTDFDTEGNYIGTSIYSVTINRE